MTGGNPEHDRRLLRRRVQPRPVPAGDHLVHRHAPGPPVIYDSPDDIDDTASTPARASSGLPGSILQHDEHAADSARPGDVPGRPEDLQADLPQPVPEGQHDLQRRPRRRAAHRLVGQASGLHVVQRARRATGSPTRSTPRSTATRSSPTGPRIPATSRGPTTTPRPCSTTPTRSRRCSTGSTATTTAARRRSARPGDLRDELPDRLDGREAPDLRRPDGRRPARHDHAGAAAAARAASTSTTSCSGWPTRSRPQGLARLDRDRPLGQARPVPAGSQPADADRRRSDHQRRQRRRGRRRTRARRRWSSPGPTTTRSCGGCRTARRQAARFVKHYLWTHTATGNTVSGGSRTLAHSGLAKIYAGKAAAPLLRRAGRQTRGTPTSGASSRSASSTPAARARSPSTAAPTRPTVTCRSSSTRPGSVQPRGV